MIKEIIEKWEKNKHLLKKHFSTNKTDYEYNDIVKLIIDKVINKDEDIYGRSYDSSKMTVIDDGDYQGTQIFIIPIDTYQPSVSQYIMTHTYYGSCSGCDTLMDIISYEESVANGNQVKDLMTLSLHLVQRMKPLSNQDD